MRRPVEDIVIGRVMMDWQLDRLLAQASDVQTITLMMRAFGYNSSEIARHHGLTSQAVSWQLGALRKKLKSGSGAI